MKKAILFFAAVLLTANVYAADDSLYKTFKDYNEIKVYIHEVKNEADNPAADEKLFASGFKEALKSRKTVRFVVVDNEANADVIVRPLIKEFVFTKEAMPLAISPLLVAADLINPKSSARLVVDYEVIDAKDGRILSVYKNLTTYARRVREGSAEDTSYDKAVRENAHRFILKAFYKPKDMK